MKVAIPMFNSRVSPRFDFASKLLIATIDSRKVVDRKEYSLDNLDPIRRTGLISELRVNTLICGGISDFSVRLLMDRGIEVIPMVPGEVEEVLNLFINSNLRSIMITNIPRRRYGHHRERRGRCKGKGRGFLPK